jgi:hypothetical protein
MGGRKSKNENDEDARRGEHLPKTRRQKRPARGFLPPRARSAPAASRNAGGGGRACPHGVAHRWRGASAPSPRARGVVWAAKRWSAAPGDRIARFSPENRLKPLRVLREGKSRRQRQYLAPHLRRGGKRVRARDAARRLCLTRRVTHSPDFLGKSVRSPSSRLVGAGSRSAVEPVVGCGCRSPASASSSPVRGKSSRENRKNQDGVPGRT